jgi:hypothetical protein
LAYQCCCRYLMMLCNRLRSLRDPGPKLFIQTRAALMSVPIRRMPAAVPGVKVLHFSALFRLRMHEDVASYLCSIVQNIRLYKPATLAIKPHAWPNLTYAY